MKAFAIACVAALVVAIGAAGILSFVQMPASDAYNAQISVRI
jgi:hypothetical protein